MYPDLGTLCGLQPRQHRLTVGARRTHLVRGGKRVGQLKNGRAIQHGAHRLGALWHL
jgi:hypothetical protein